MPYFSGQGRVYIGARDAAGNPQGLNFVGNVPELKVSLSVETLEHQESTSGQRLTDLQLIKTKKGEFACTLEELIAVNLSLALYGTTVEQTSGTVTSEALPNPVIAGSLYLLAKQNVSSVVVKDSSATPKTLPAVQYSLNAKHGSLSITDKTTGGPFVEPFKVDYAYGAAQSTALFTQPLPERWVRFEGLNTADSNREVVIDLYRVAINPAKELSIITEELLKFELSGQVLADTQKSATGDLGQFGRIVLL
ncbi:MULTISPECIES: phage tail tube protein [Burkholderiaceae]|uniref:Uncharacterized protein n=1 Tax=Ralstonia mannitolilytica TaxID=105219 RepID=A0AAJ4ZNG2_9RALS|nr:MULTISPECIES: hypothetical protein [Burkholderiaceae]MCM3604062.1 hypothetical protein [Cupriavidus pauculus]CAG2149421.1 hypothetical protein LMG6866_03650 [Ralstonia mannitolilytica]CAJ0728620.1 hypothetical protein R76706_01763 [Ralstonia mannitolilytica]CAJ0739252.1 hypothetical protein R76696_02364 [Ralstonia mannitolilytica]CAJ0861333.1 hypothetical protein R77569_01425 [Ralstonia mannitolilytica]